MALHVVLEGRRVRLEPLEPRHEEELWTVAQDPRTWRWMRFNGYERDEFSRFWASVDMGFAHYLDGELVGHTSFLNDRPEDRATLDALEKDARETLADKSIPLAADDISGLYETLTDARVALKDEAGARKLREERAAFLEQQAKKAKTPEQRAVFDSHRMSVYMDLKEPERAIPMLDQSERDLPNDYNPPARLGAIYRTMGKYEEALAAYDRALPKAYGPRKIGILRGKADTYALKGDKESAKRTIQEAIRYAESLPEGQRSDSTIAALKKKLETL